MGVSMATMFLTMEKIYYKKWMGKNIAPIYQSWFDIDYEWQLPLLKYWLKNTNNDRSI